jgi:glutathione-regulated potassium-efflux system ancillary protein KefG
MTASTARARFSARTEVPEQGGVLVLFCHPQRHRSRVNGALVRAVTGLHGVTVHDLYEHYPDMGVDVGREQALLLSHHTIVFQHPFYWYSTPALLKEWQDHVLQFGWAYGPGGVALRGKQLLTAISTGGSVEAYRPEGMHGTTVRALLAPIAQTARLCGMPYLPPFVVHGAHQISDADLQVAAADYRAVIEALRDGILDGSAVTASGNLDAARATRGRSVS